MVVLHTAPDVSLADPPWLASYIALGAGLLLLVGGKRSGHHRLDVQAMVDLVAVATVALLVVWQFSLQETLMDSSQAIFVRLVWSAYPILDAVLVGLVVRLVVSRRTGTRTGILLALGVGCWLISDFAFTLLAPSHSVVTSLDAGWMAGAIMLAAACGVTGQRTPPGRRTETRVWSHQRGSLSAWCRSSSPVSSRPGATSSVVRT